MGIFISHIAEESPLALVLNKWIESTFSGQFGVFVSSDPEDIPSGSKWLDKIDEALKSSKVEIILCSPSSIGRPWIHFEAGCAWIKEIPIIPICHSGLSKSNLPQPLSTFQALELEDNDFSKKLINDLAQHLGLKKIPPITHNEMMSELRNATASIKTKDDQVIQNHIQKEPTVKKHLELRDKEIELLKTLSSKEKFLENELAEILKIKSQRLRYYLECLEDKQYIYVSRSMHINIPNYYSLSKKGRAFLVENNLL